MPGEERLPPFVTQLVEAKPCSGAIKIRSNAGTDDVYTRYFSLPYAKQLAFALLQILAENYPELNTPFDDLRLKEDGQNLRFTLLREGKPALSGAVTKDVAAYALKFLTHMFDGPNVIRPEKFKRKKG